MNQNNQQMISPPSLSSSRTYIPSHNPLTKTSSILNSLNTVKVALVESALRANARIEEEEEEYRMMEVDRVDRIERRRRIGFWINDTLRHNKTTIPKAQTATFKSLPATVRLPSIAVMLEYTSLRDSASTLSTSRSQLFTHSTYSTTEREPYSYSPQASGTGYQCQLTSQLSAQSTSSPFGLKSRRRYKSDCKQVSRESGGNVNRGRSSNRLCSRRGRLIRPLRLV